MEKRHHLNRLLSVAALALLFGGTSVYAQSTTPDASGMTKENKAGKMSPTGQNETSSAKPPASGSSDTGSKSSAGSSGSSDTGSKSSASSSGSSDTSSSASTSAGGKTLSKSDQNLMREIAQSNLAEIEAAKVAQSKSSSQQVKDFAQKMIDDHTQAQKDLEQLAQSKGVTLPTEPDKKHQAEIKKLGALEGSKFDKQYMAKGGVSDHRSADNFLKRAERRAKDSDLKALVAKIKPTVDQHLAMAKDIASGKGTASGSSAGSTGKSASGSSSSDTSGSGSSTGKSSTGNK